MLRSRLRLRAICFASVLLSAPLLSAGTLFKKAQSYTSGGQNAISMAVADVNRDGKPDLIIANLATGSVAVLLGNGNGTFQAPQTYPFFMAYAVAVRDLNGDGKPDIVVTSSYGSSVVGVFLGNGDGTFQPPTTYSTGGPSAESIVISDVNHDSKPDLLVGNNSCCVEHAVVGVLLGNGDGTFQGAQIYDSGGYGDGGPYGGVGISLAVVDLNGDGKPDLVTGLPSIDGSIGVLLGNGDGTFQAPHIYNTLASYTSSVAAADVNGDGKNDVVTSDQCDIPTCNGKGSSVSVLLGNGNGTFQTATTYFSGGIFPANITIGDVTRDGKPDLIVVNRQNGVSSAGSAGVLLGKGDGSFQSAQVYASGGDFATSVAVNDVNGDGKVDLLMTNASLDYSRGLDGSAAVRLNRYFASTTTTLTSTPNPSVFGQPVTLTAKVISVGLDLPTGKVIFKNSGVAFGSAILSGGIATFTTTKLPVGTLSLTAAYRGDTFSAKSKSAVLIQVVNP